MAHTQHIYKHKTMIFKVVTELIHVFIEQYVSACNFISFNFWQTHGGNVMIIRRRFPPFQFTQNWRELRWRRLWRTSPNAWKTESSIRVNRDGMLFYGKLSLHQNWQQSHSKHTFFRLVLGPRPTGPVGPTIWWVRVPGFPGKKMCNTSSDNNLIIFMESYRCIRIDSNHIQNICSPIWCWAPDLQAQLDLQFGECVFWISREEKKCNAISDNNLII